MTTKQQYLVKEYEFYDKTYIEVNQFITDNPKKYKAPRYRCEKIINK